MFKLSRKMDVAVFGGSFDPPHIGHVEIVKQCIQNLNIDKIFVVPTYLNPFKNSFTAPSNLRASWIEKALLSYPKAQVLRYEIEQNRPVSTIETIKYLLDNFHINKIYLIIGADNLASLHKWKDYEKLKDLVEFVIASRDDINIPKNLQKLDIHVSISSTKLRDKIEKKYLPKSIADEVMEYYEQKS